MTQDTHPITCLRTLTDTAAARAAEFELAPKAQGAVHYHSNVEEYCVCLQGTCEVAIDDHPARRLQTGERVDIPAGARHQILNATCAPCQYLVVQYGGVYDFIEAPHTDP